MNAVIAAFNQEKALVGAFYVIVQLVVEPMDRFAALIISCMPRSVFSGGQLGIVEKTGADDLQTQADRSAQVGEFHSACIRRLTIAFTIKSKDPISNKANHWL